MYCNVWTPLDGYRVVWGSLGSSGDLQTAPDSADSCRQSADSCRQLQTAADRSPEMRVRAAPRGLPRSGEVVKGTVNDIMRNGSHVFDL